jgi:peroxiredoxin
MKQLVQLQEHRAEFDAAGIAIVALTYDPPELQEQFVDRFGIGYPLLSDISAESVSALGILNAEYEPGDDAYGIPHPGIFVIRPDGSVAGKLFVEEYMKRVDATAVLAHALQVLN